MNHGEISFQPLLLVTMLGLIVPFLIYRIRFIRIPVVVGEIFCGVLFGKSGLNLITSEPILDFLSLLGFTYLMFLGGMEIDFESITNKRIRPSEGRFAAAFNPIVISSMVLGMTLTLGYISVRLLGYYGMLPPMTSNIMLVLMISTTSVGVVLPAIKEAGIIEGKYGQTLLLSAVFIDFATIFIATVTLVVLRGDRGGPLELAKLIGLFVVFYGLFILIRRLSSNPFIKKVYTELSNTPSQLRVRTAFALMVLFAFLSQSVGIELILGAFVAGMLFSIFFKSTSSESAAKFDAIGFGFLIPVFFIMVGARMDLGVISHSPGMIWTALILLGVAFMIKIIPLLPFSFIFGFRNASAGGILLAGKLSLIIAFAEVAVAEKLIDPSMRVIAIIIAVGTCVLAPMLFEKFHIKEPSFSKMDILILGAGKMGRSIAKRFTDHGHAVKLLDTDREAVEKAESEGLSAHYYNELHVEELARTGARTANIFIALTNDDKTNLDTCLFVRDSFGITELTARVGNPDNTELFTKNNIRPMNTTQASVDALENLIINSEMKNGAVEKTVQVQQQTTENNGA